MLFFLGVYVFSHTSASVSQLIHRLKYFRNLWMDCIDIQYSQRMNTNDFSDPLTFSLVPCLENYHMNLHDISGRYSLDGSQWVCWSLDCSSRGIIRSKLSLIQWDVSHWMNWHIVQIFMASPWWMTMTLVISWHLSWFNTCFIIK